MAEETGTGPCVEPRIVNDGQRAWSMKQNRNGYRTYTITHRVAVERGTHGPASALYAPGLPEPGSIWTEPDLVDAWSFFTQEVDVTQVGDTAKSQHFDVTQYATNEPASECF